MKTFLIKKPASALMKLNKNMKITGQGTQKRLKTHTSIILKDLMVMNMIQTSIENGRYVYRGTWGRTNSSSSGQVVFYFSEDNRSFTGYYTRGNSTTQHQWSGQVNCQ